MSEHWIVNNEGWRGLVDSDEDLATWIQLYGWQESTQPDEGSSVQTYIRNPNAPDQVGGVPYFALASGWAELGWAPGAPPTPTDTTRPKRRPAPVPRPPEEDSVEVSETTKTGAAGVSKETKSRG